MIFGQRLKQLRNERGLYQAQLSDQFNKKFNTKLARSSISTYETSDTIPEMAVLVDLATFFDVTVDYLLGRTDERSCVTYSGDSIPDELKKLGVQEVQMAKDILGSGLNVEQLKEAIRFIQNLEKLKD